MLDEIRVHVNALWYDSYLGVGSSTLTLLTKVNKRLLNKPTALLLGVSRTDLRRNVHAKTGT